MSNKNMNILVTGSAGFIGFHTSLFLLNKNMKVCGIDNLNNYYDTQLKKDRLNILKKFENFSFVKCDLTDMDTIDRLMEENHITHIINLAAQAGVRYSLENPHAYVNSNLVGFVNILELARKYKVKKLIYASSSSVYGDNTASPSSENHVTDTQISLYGATKKSNELMAYSYFKLFKLESVGLRFFSVYGPWGRPDMALFLFTDAILKNKKINVFNFGKMQRDFTYIDDIVSGIYHSLSLEKEIGIYNLGNNKTVELMYLIETIEKNIGKKAEINFLPMQKGDIQKSCADIEKAKSDLLYSPNTSIEHGVENFINWYKQYYRIKI
tara:strand:- start:522 stop:1496 length:975 start_codon:yes stop_codon:yes gene_type:complete